MEPILELREVKKEYKGFALKEVSFALDRGYIMGFIGPNGSGKSTTIKLIMNLLNRDSGEIQIFGRDNIRHAAEIKQRIGFIYDQNHFYDELTLEQTKKAISGFYTKWDDKLYDKYMKQFGLKKNQKMKELSKGMQTKFSLAIALSHNAELIIMDEPTSGLDPVFRSQLLDILMEVIQDEEKAIFFSTHITTDLEKVADYITFINDGRVMFSQGKDEILDKYRIVKGSAELLDQETTESFVGIKRNKFGFEGLTTDVSRLRNMDELIIERPTLDDIMLFTVRGKGRDV